LGCTRDTRYRSWYSVLSGLLQSHQWLDMYQR
jgi:hypothetical protein